MSKSLSNQEPKGTRDWFPEEFLIRKYIFDTWRRVCLSYGFEEYLTPIVENADIYRLKSGEDVGGKELLSFTDLGGRELSIRPEMTPSVTRMVTKIYNKSPKPLKYFSIANFIRNEKPQRGRNREFWQLNVDIFGSNSVSADIEIMQLTLDLMLKFNAPQNSFILGINNRKLLEALLKLAGVEKVSKEVKVAIVRTLDKWKKLTPPEIKKQLRKLGLGDEALEVLNKFMSSGTLNELMQKLPELKEDAGLKETLMAIDQLKALGYEDWIQFDPTVIRGFDYYDGLVFEVCDQKKGNDRALFGGGRYNGLAEIFGQKNFPAVGIAQGDETIKLFLEDWDLLSRIPSNKNNQYYLPLLDKSLFGKASYLAKELRAKGFDVLLGLDEQKLGKALDFANKKGLKTVIIFGQEELEKGVYKIKNMESGEEIEEKL